MYGRNMILPIMAAMIEENRTAPAAMSFIVFIAGK